MTYILHIFCCPYALHYKFIHLRLFTEMTTSQDTERSCVRGIDFALCFNDFWIILWNCSDHVVFLVYSFIHDDIHYKRQS